MKQLYDVTYPVKRTGLTRQRIWDLCRQNAFPHVRLGRQIRFDADAVEAFIASGGQSLPGGWRREER